MPTLRVILAGCVALTACDRQPAERAGEQTRLGPALATLPYGFTNLTSAVELSDSRVLLSDPSEGSLFVTDSALTTVRPFGTRGQGPLEYTNAGSLIGFGNDSSLQVDMLARRWLLLRRDSVVTQLPGDDPLVAPGNLVTGADRSGNVLLMVPPATDSRTGQPINSGESTALVLASRRTGTQDTIGRLEMGASTGAAGTIGYYQPFEWGHLSLDGWIAVQRLEPYRVDWRSPEGQWTLGEPLPDDSPVIDDAEQKWLGQVLRGPERLGPDWQDRVYWPDRVPPLRLGTGQVHTRDSLLVLLRQPHSRAPEVRYDVIDRQGELVGRIVLDDGQRLLGFGPGTVYLVTTDSDGLKWLSRHRWPPW